MRKRRWWVLAAALALAGCAGPVTKAVEGSLPRERGTECRSACDALGMKLTSVVLILNSAGCVCQVLEAPDGPPGAKPLPPPPISQADGASAVAGGAAIAAVIAAQQQRSAADDAAQRQRQQPSHH